MTARYLCFTYMQSIFEKRNGSAAKILISDKSSPKKKKQIHLKTLFGKKHKINQ